MREPCASTAVGPHPELKCTNYGFRVGGWILLPHPKADPITCWLIEKVREESVVMRRQYQWCRVQRRDGKSFGLKDWDAGISQGHRGCGFKFEEIRHQGEGRSISG